MAVRDFMVERRVERQGQYEHSSCQCISQKMRAQRRYSKASVAEETDKEGGPFDTRGLKSDLGCQTTLQSGGILTMVTVSDQSESEQVREFATLRKHTHHYHNFVVFMHHS